MDHDEYIDDAFPLVLMYWIAFWGISVSMELGCQTIVNFNESIDECQSLKMFGIELICSAV